MQNNLLWNHHLELGKDSILSKCKKSIGALKFAAGGSNFNIKKRLADAVVMSRLIYAIQIWGAGSSDSTLRKVQTVQNLTMSWISGLPRRTRTLDLLKKVKWLSINQLVYYHGFLSMYKIQKNGGPPYNLKHLNAGVHRRGRIDLTKRRWSSKIQRTYNTLESEIRNENKISVFKKKIKNWIINNIGVFNCND